MKNRNSIIAFLFALGLGFSCTDESTYPIDFDLVNNSNAGILSQVEIRSVTFDINGIPSATYDLTLEANDAGRGTLFTKVEIYAKFSDRTTANGVDNSKPEVKMRTIQAADFVKDATTGLPRTDVLITAPETLTALGLPQDSLSGSDQFVYRHEMHMNDGRIFSSNNVTTAIASLGGVYKSPFQSVVPIVCPSDLGGTVNYTSTVLLAGSGTPGSGVNPGCTEPIVGTTLFTPDPDVPGTYIIQDASFGLWNASCLAYGDSEGNSFSDSCNLLSVSGTDQYGDSYTWTILSVTPDGVTLNLKWENTYGDGGTVALTRTGKTWPLGLYTNP